jgi:hypothetical protein
VKTPFIALIALTTYALLASGANAQAEPEAGGNEVQVWTGGGHGLNGSTSGTGVWNLGFRYGWVLTDAVGPGPLRGRFEYAVDVVPAFVVKQRNGAAYGIGLNPFALKWDFVPRRGVVPYAEIGGGTLFSNTHVAHKLHEFGSDWRALFASQKQLECGSAVHAHLQCGAGVAESGDQYDSSADRFRPLQWTKVK